MTTRAQVTRLCRRPGVPSPGPFNAWGLRIFRPGQTLLPKSRPAPVRYGGRGRAAGSGLVAGQASAGSRTNTGIWRVVFCWYSAYGG